MVDKSLKNSSLRPTEIKDKSKFIDNDKELMPPPSIPLKSQTRYSFLSVF